MIDDRKDALDHSSRFSHLSSNLWGITDGSAGMQSQVEGVLEATGLPYELKVCSRRKPFAWLPVRMHWGALWQLDRESDVLIPPWPQAVVTSGRRSAALALEIKKASGGATCIIHLTDPRDCREQFDLIVPMEHDAAEGKNIFPTQFALHRLTHERLEAAAAAWQGKFSALPDPYAAVLIGGSTNQYQFTPQAADALIALLKEVLAQNDVSLLITTSRRTGEENAQRIRSALKDHPRVWWHEAGAGGENPYLGMLALADWLLVTDDSVNMMSEAAYTGKPLYILELQGHTYTKPVRFAATLVGKGIARVYEAGPLEQWMYNMPEEREQVAARIRRLLGSAPSA